MAVSITECETIIRKIREKAPEAAIILNALFPVGKTVDNPHREVVATVNNLISRFADNVSVHWLDIGNQLLLEDGTADPSKMAGDSLHIAAGGYEVWAVKLERVIEWILIG